MTETAKQVLTPETEADLSDIIQSGDQFCVQGGGTRGISTIGAALSTSGMRGITLYEPSALTMVARAGTPLSEIEDELDANGQMLGFEPYVMNRVTGSTSLSTIGGVFATNASGSRRVSAGAARDFLLGVRLVDGRGNIISNGGRVMKNVTGYDLVKLMAGSYGSLGVLSEVSFKTLPKPERTATYSLSVPDSATALAAMRAALATPYEISGALVLTEQSMGRHVAFLRLEGTALSVAYRAEKLKDILSKFAKMEEADGRIWQQAKTFDLFGENIVPSGLWSISIRSSDAPQLIGDLSAKLSCAVAYDWAGGRILVAASDAALLAGGANGAAATHAEGATQYNALLHDAMKSQDGHATRLWSKYNNIGPRFEPKSSVVEKLHAGLRVKFDPDQKFNRGMMS